MSIVHWSSDVFSSECIGFRVGHTGCLLWDVMGRDIMPARTRGGPGLILCARCIVTALLFGAKRQRNAALHLFAIDPAFVAAVFAAHRELATHRRALLVD